MGGVDMLQNTLGCGVVPLRRKLRRMGASCRAAGWVRKLLRGFLRRLFGLLGKIRVLLAPADQLGGACGFVDLDKPVPAHFLRNFIAGFQLFAQFVSPPIRALARVQ